MYEFEDILKKDEGFRYQLLDRMRMDCDYYLGYGGRYSLCLWAKNEIEQIAYMKAIWNSFPANKKPEFITYKQILEYEEKLCKADVSMRKSLYDYISENFAAYELPIYSEDHMRSFLNKLEAHGESLEDFIEGRSYSYDFIDTYSVKLAAELIDECNAFFCSWNEFAERFFDTDSIAEAMEFLRDFLEYGNLVLTTDGIVELNIV